MSLHAPNPFDGTTRWIWSDEGLAGPRPDRNPFRIRHFRRAFDAPAGARLIVHVSADSRYRLWCNGAELAYGPAKGDIEHHFFETVDATPHLRAGANVLAATVEYYGDSWAEVPQGSPCSRMSARPGFTLHGIVRDEAGTPLGTVHSDRSWRVLRDEAMGQQDAGMFTHWLGGTEVFDCARHPWGFQLPGFDDAAWAEARETAPAVPEGWNCYATSPHRLMPRMIEPLERSTPRRFARVVRVSPGADAAAWERLAGGQGEVTVPAGTTTTVILDAGAETTGYPRLAFRGGAGATVHLTCAETLKTPEPHAEVRGYVDTVRPDGPARVYEPFNWRTFRYIAVDVATRAEPITLSALDHRFCGYPFAELARFASSDADHARIWEIAWRTARLCAHETYEDCPYYEQLQYGGDTQVQAMISYYVAGDASLARQFLYQYDWSRTPDGLTRSRYPARVPQVIPFWSLHWVMSVHDYWRYTGDMETVRDLMPGVLAVMDHFDRRLTADGTIGRLTGWLCADWCPQWTKDVDGNGVPPGTATGRGAFVNLMTIAALEQVADLVKATGGNPAELRRRSTRLRDATHRVFFDAGRGLYRDRPEGELASAYTNVWAILAGMPCDAGALAARIVSDRTLCQLTMFSAYFAYRALAKAGRYDLAPALLEPWRGMVAAGLTTCPEIPDHTRTRSFCHAWSAAPPVEFLGEILGVRPLQPGYGEIGIEPKPGGLAFARGRVPLTRMEGSAPVRFVDVEWRIEEGKFHLTADIPEGVPCIIRLPDGRTRRAPKGGRVSVTAKLEATPED